MENQKSTSKQIMLNYGLTLGLLGILINVIIYALGYSYNIKLLMITGLSLIIISIVFLVVGIKKFRKYNGGFLKFSEGLKIGMGIIVISAVLSVGYNYLFSNYIEPDYEKNMILVSEQWTIETFSIPEEAVFKMQEENEARIAELEPGSFKPVVKSLSISLIIGLIFSAIISLFLRKSEDID